jgi:hypothetical protein
LRERKKLGFTRSARFPHGRTNPPTLRGNLFVSRAARPHREFVNPIPSKDRVGVRIHETREHHAIPRVHDLDLT